MPIFAFGFIKVRSLNFEEFAKIFIKHKFGNNKRTYENKLNIELIKCQENDITKKEVKKVDFNREKETEFEGTRTISRNAKIKKIRERIKRAKKEFKEEKKRTETAEIIESKEQFKMAKEKYQTARNRKNNKNKKGKTKANNTKYN